VFKSGSSDSVVLVKIHCYTNAIGAAHQGVHVSGGDGASKFLPDLVNNGVTNLWRGLSVVNELLYLGKYLLLHALVEDDRCQEKR